MRRRVAADVTVPVAGAPGPGRRAANVGVKVRCEVWGRARGLTWTRVWPPARILGPDLHLKALRLFLPAARAADDS